MVEATDSSPLRNRCPHCGRIAEVPAHLVGETIPCPNPDCNEVFCISVPKGEPVDADEIAEANVLAGEVETRQAGPISDEAVLFKVHPAVMRARPLFALLAVLLGLGGLVLVVFAMAARWTDFEAGAMMGPLTQIVAGGILAAAALFVLAWWWIQSRFMTLTVTNKRCTYREGIISRDTSEVQHEDVRNLQVEQSVLQRILGIGDLAISSSGQDDLEIEARGIPRPERVAEAIRRYE